MQYFWNTRENIPDGVGMGQYTAGHIGWLIAGALICLALALVYRKMSKKEREEMIVRLTAEMKAAAKILEFEHAAFLRDKIEKLRRGK